MSCLKLSWAAEVEAHGGPETWVVLVCPILRSSVLSPGLQRLLPAWAESTRLAPEGRPRPWLLKLHLSPEEVFSLLSMVFMFEDHEFGVRE